MKKTVSWCGVLLCCASLLLFFLFSACDQLPDILDDSETGVTVTAEDLEGTWIKTFDTPVTYDDEGSETDALIIEITDTEYEMVLYFKTMQNGGNRGTYEIGTDGTVTLTVEESWNSTDAWVADPDQYDVTYSPSEETLSGEVGEADPENIDLEKVVFANLSELVNVWKSEPIYPQVYSADDPYIEFIMDPTGDYTYVESDRGDTPPFHDESGVWDATETFIRSVVTDMSEYGEQVTEGCPIGYLNPYTEDTDTQYDNWGADQKLTITVYDESGNPITLSYWNWTHEPIM